MTGSARSSPRSRSKPARFDSPIGADPAAAPEQAAELRTELRAAVADIRRLVHGLRPPALDELGLVGALRERTGPIGAARRLHPMTTTTMGRLSRAGRPLDRARRDCRRCRPRSRSLSIRIVDEALTNVAKHAGARVCLIGSTSTGRCADGRRRWRRPGPDRGAAGRVVLDAGTGGRIRRPFTIGSRGRRVPARASSCASVPLPAGRMNGDDRNRTAAAADRRRPPALPQRVAHAARQPCPISRSSGRPRPAREAIAAGAASCSRTSS